MNRPTLKKTLWRPEHEKDACGVGFIAEVSGKPSHRVLRMAIQGVCCVTHRGAVSADAKTGDGAGIQTQIPRKLFARELRKLGVAEEKVKTLGVGVFFFPQDPGDRSAAKGIVDRIIKERKLTRYGWREVPVNPSALGEEALSTMPVIQQLLVGPSSGGADDAPEVFDRLLYYVRRQIERAFDQARLTGAYIPSFSCRTIVYKGLLVAPQLTGFYEDLADPVFETAIALFHQRYSTNTFPDWVRAQPFRHLGHNGEINTLLGNRNWMRAREPELRSPIWGDRIKELFPIIQPEGSDSGMLDNALELLIHSGFSILHGMALLIPEAWQNMPGMDPAEREFFEYQACLSEPWDGPAAVAFTDGVVVGATLDRNGLRPARYKVTRDGLVVLGSEVGIVDLDEGEVIESGRLAPGEMIAVDTVRKKLLRDHQIKMELATARPYGRWLADNLIRADELKLNDGKPMIETAGGSPEELNRRMKTFCFTQEDLHFIVKAMAETGKEPVGSMGDDAPFSILSDRPKPLATYFKQLFAQVTNPAIDPLREKLVMSLNTALGERGSMLEETPEHARWIKFGSPILTGPELAWLENQTEPAFRSARIPVLFPAADGPKGLKSALDRICRAASAAVDGGASILILSDRGVDARQAAVPMLMAVGAVHHRLIRQGKRMRGSLVCETASVWDTHGHAILIGYGAAAIHPYGLLETTAAACANGIIRGVSSDEACAQVKKAIEDGILKIMSKMGISCVSSYRGAQIFQAIGLGAEVIDPCFAGTASQIGGVGFDLLGAEVLALHASAYGKEAQPELDLGGFYRFRRETERHAFSPQVIAAMHKAVHSDDWTDYEKYMNLVNDREPICLRDLLEFASDRKPIPLSEVEPVRVIQQRFCTAGMSYGALSKETHECLAIAMNRIGGKSNSGEGGEDPARLKPYPNGDSACSAIKQVASGRFGVTPEYLSSARELEIKVAQGSKPGEGGQLPGHKVSEDIARVRHSVPGVTLISPPPHHDIYSIEDLAQLIYDLKACNKQAEVCVKLVACAGVGTIAAGVAKGYADVVHIAGHDGGTGASPISSIKHAGSAWELGVAETQQVLVMNNLRSRITLRTDGGLKTGRDIVVAALLGAEEYNFGTAALVAAGCCMVRQCHLNTCPVGVATQDPKLRLKFKETPEVVVRFFDLIAEEVRRVLAELGYRSLEELVGRVHLLKVKEKARNHPKWRTIDWEAILADPDPSGKLPRRCLTERNDRVGDHPLDERIVLEAGPAIEGRAEVTLRHPVKNDQRSIGTRLSHEIALRHGDAGLPAGAGVTVELTGSAGQSFGAFLIHGVRLVLAGDANDYVGKGMHGGQIVVKPHPKSRAKPGTLALIGNTCLYGATGGRLYAAGRAGERFGVRNSGARAVVEAVGDHGCEYMTSGLIVVLGPTGRNFGAGMTGGQAFVLDEDGKFDQRLNPSLVEATLVVDPEDRNLLKGMVTRHAELTGSVQARELLNDWESAVIRFRKVAPKGNVVALEAAPGTPEAKKG
ncbi:MAG: glutamate synthase large subunit [Candidatus Omnitrophica bacterium CG11_big_fil_rev_8_21_14_0_20_64_10]|nr:MAG: glutamate synthase large subunit [Candidatus Omnitrophica bacterium CG11_big_fil_rev_8_21_14_0_20_64_10]